MAARAGFQSNDILLTLDGKAVNVRFDEEMPLLNLMVADIPIGKEVAAVVRRDGKELTLTVRTAEREAPEFKQVELKAWGMTVKNISFMAAKEMKLANREGVLVTTIRPGGPCGEAKPNLQPGDVLKTVAGKPVKNVADLVARTQGLTATKKTPVPTSG